MAAQYDLKPGLSPKGKEEEQVLYPKLVAYGTKTLKDILNDATLHSGLNASTVLGVVTFLEDTLAEYLANGYNVKLGNIGTFSASLKSRKVTTKEEIRAKSIHFDNVRFKAAKELKKEIAQQMKLERVDAYRAFKSSLLRRVLTGGAFPTALQPSGQAWLHHPQGLLRTERSAEDESLHRAEKMVSGRENRQGRTRASHCL